MRSFDDAQGNHWQAALMDASYGSTVVVFSCAGSGVLRKAVLDAENMRLAEEQLAGLDDSQLRDLLGQSEPWG